MSDAVKLMFAFVSMVAVLIVVVAMLNNPTGTKALGGTVFGGFNSILGTLAGAQRATPGML